MHRVTRYRPWVRRRVDIHRSCTHSAGDPPCRRTGAERRQPCFVSAIARTATMPDGVRFRCGRSSTPRTSPDRRGTEDT